MQSAAEHTMLIPPDDDPSLPPSRQAPPAGPSWTTARHGAFPWSCLVNTLRRRNFTGTFMLPAEYTDPGGQPQRMGDDVLPFLAADVAYLRALVNTAWSQ
jgi:hypothetical protein